MDESLQHFILREVFICFHGKGNEIEMYDFQILVLL